MRRARRLADTLRRSAHAGAALLRSTAVRPTAPLKLNFCLTYWCQYAARPATSGSASRLTSSPPMKSITFIRRESTRHLGGSDRRRDFSAAGHRRDLRRGRHGLAPPRAPALSDQRLSDRPHRRVRSSGSPAAARRRRSSRSASTATRQLNDEIRGIKGGFSRQIDTFNGAAPHSGNHGRLRRDAVDAQPRTLRRRPSTPSRASVPGLTINDVHMNVAQVSAHYYGNDRGETDAAGFREAPRRRARVSSAPRPAAIGRNSCSRTHTWDTSTSS